MHKIAISPAALDRMTRRMGKLHPFDTMAPRKTGLLVIDMQNYFVKPGHQGEIPAAREIVPNINRLAAGLRRHAGRLGRAGGSAAAAPHRAGIDGRLVELCTAGKGALAAWR